MSGLPSPARRTTASCAAAVSLSPTSACPACRTSLSSAARSRMRTSAASHVPPRQRGAVFTADDLAGVKPIRAVSGLPGFKISEQPVLATGKVRHVGELVAMCVAPTRAEAEDIAATVDARSRGVAGRSSTCCERARADAPLRARAMGR